MRKHYTDHQIRTALDTSLSLSEACRKLQCRGSTLRRWMQKYGLDWEKWKNMGRKGRDSSQERKYTAEQAFQKNMPLRYAFKYLKEEREWKCEQCGLSEWQGSTLPLEVHHINGDHWDQRRENLQILCPNCHALTKTWRSKGRKKEQQISDAEIVNYIKESENIHEALNKLGMSSKGANYARVQRLLAKEYLKSIKVHESNLTLGC